MGVTPHDSPVDGERLRLERFDYSRIGTHWAVIRLVTRLLDDIGLVGTPALVIDHRNGTGPTYYPARACVSERLLPRLQTGASALLWRGAFAVPAGIAEHPDAAFALHDGDELLLSLPAPALRTITPRSLRLQRPAPARPTALATITARRRAATVATVAALTTTSSPAAAFAATVTQSSTHTAQTTQTTQTAQTATVPAASGAATTTMTPAQTSAAPSSTTSTTATPSPAPVAPAATTAGTPTPMAAATTSTTVSPATTVAAPPAAATPAATATTTTSGAVTAVTTTAPTATTTATTAASGVTPSGAHHRRRRHRHHRAAVTVAHPQPTRDPAAPPATEPAPASATTEGTAAPGTAAPGTATAQGTAAAQNTAIARRAAAHRQRAAARRIAVLSAGVRQAAARARADDQARADDAQRSTAIRTAAAPTLSATAASSSGTAVHLLSTTPGFTGPSSWTGVVSPESSLTGAVRNLSGLLSDGDRPPSFLIPIYMAAGRHYHVPWEVLASINAIESDYGRDLNTSTAGAIGWMQFEPSTWKRYGVAADGVSEANPYDPRDAIFAAARYLHAAGGSTDIRQAVFAYNHADWYVDEVLQRAQAISEHVQYERATVTRRDAVSVAFDTDLKGHPTVRYSSGVLSRFDRLIAAANMVSAADFPYLWGGGHQQPSRFGPFDCSGSVSYVMQQAGYRVDTTVAADVGSWHLPAGPGRVTIFYNAKHTFMRIGGRYFGTSGFARPGGGAGWFDVDRLPAGYLAKFHEVHVPGLGIDSFSADAALPLGRAPLTPRARQAAHERASLHAFNEARLGDLASQAVADQQVQLVQTLVRHSVDLLRPTSGG